MLTAIALSFVLGALHPEDLAHIPETPWLIASGFSEGAGLKLVDTRTSSLRTWYSGSPRQVRPDVVVFPGCPTAPDPTLFNAHGISLRPAGASLYTLHVVNHGGRESIEVFVVTHMTRSPP